MSTTEHEFQDWIVKMQQENALLKKKIKELENQLIKDRAFKKSYFDSLQDIYSKTGLTGHDEL